MDFTGFPDKTVPGLSLIGPKTRRNAIKVPYFMAFLMDFYGIS